jgi:hypothetical protein
VTFLDTTMAAILCWRRVMLPFEYCVGEEDPASSAAGTGGVFLYPILIPVNHRVARTARKDIDVAWHDAIFFHSWTI